MEIRSEGRMASRIKTCQVCGDEYDTYNETHLPQMEVTGPARHVRRKRALIRMDDEELRKCANWLRDRLQSCDSVVGVLGITEEEGSDTWEEIRALELVIAKIERKRQEARMHSEMAAPLTIKAVQFKDIV